MSLNLLDAGVNRFWPATYNLLQFSAAYILCFTSYCLIVPTRGSTSRHLAPPGRGVRSAAASASQWANRHSNAIERLQRHQALQDHHQVRTNTSYKPCLINWEVHAGGDISFPYQSHHTRHRGQGSSRLQHPMPCLHCQDRVHAVAIRASLGSCTTCQHAHKRHHRHHFRRHFPSQQLEDIPPHQSGLLRRFLLLMLHHQAHGPRQGYLLQLFLRCTLHLLSAVLGLHAPVSMLVTTFRRTPTPLIAKPAILLIPRHRPTRPQRQRTWVRGLT